MFVRITNTPRPYEWGSTTAIAALLGTVASGGPEAELWLGTHPGSPARLVDPDPGGAATLPEWLAAHPEALVTAPNTQEGFGEPGLPFLLKVLAAASPLSLQAHPTAEQARAGFERENAAGIPLDAPHRNYRDPFPKPEIIVAVSEQFRALCGFRKPADAAATVRALTGHSEGGGSQGGDHDDHLRAFADRIMSHPIASTFEWLLTRGDGVDELIEAVGVCAQDAGGGPAETVRLLAVEYPGDPGIAISLLLNTVTLGRGEALLLPAGSIHAYLSGLGIELMTSSDNVLRGGLTRKHVDVPELLSVLNFEPVGVPWLRPSRAPGMQTFTSDAAALELTHVTGGALLEPVGAAVALCVAGAVTVSGRESSIDLTRGDAIFVPTSEGPLTFSRGGELFVASGR